MSPETMKRGARKLRFKILDAVAAVGIDLEVVAHTLEEEGVAAFVKSFDELIGSLTAKADSLR